MGCHEYYVFRVRPPLQIVAHLCCNFLFNLNTVWHTTFSEYIGSSVIWFLASAGEGPKEKRCHHGLVLDNVKSGVLLQLPL